MSTLSATRQELDIRHGPEGSPPADWEPLVQWSEDIGLYVIAQTAIRFCPWCGSELPDDSEAAAARVEKEGFVISVGWDGEVRATLKGDPVDPDELLSRSPLPPAND